MNQHKLFNLARQCLLAILFLSVSVTHCWADLPKQPAQNLIHTQHQFRHLGIENGLSQSNIYSILQDKQDFLWFGTLDGLNKYDGYKFTIYRHKPSDQNSLSNNLVRVLYEGQDGIIWIGTSSGLNRFDPTNESFRHFWPDPIAGEHQHENSINSLLEDKQGILWIGSDEGLASFNTHTEELKYHNSNISNTKLGNEKITALFIDSNNTFWIGTNKGLGIYSRDTEIFTRFTTNQKNKNSISHNEITTIYEDKSGVLWIGTNQGLNRYNSAQSNFTRLLHQPNKPDSISNNSISAIIENNAGQLWVATLGGLNLLDRTLLNFTHIQYDPYHFEGLTSDYILSLIEDKHHNLWIGTRASGINYYTSEINHFTNYRHRPGYQDSLSNKSVRSVHEDRNGNLWVGSDSGLDKYNQERIVTNRYSFNNHFSGNVLDKAVRAVYEDSEGDIWAGTPSGLNRLNPSTNKITHYTHNESKPNSLVNNFVLVLFEDSRHRLWIGTNKGLSRYNRKDNLFTNYHYHPKGNNGISGNSVRAIHEDLNGNIWVAAIGGLSLYQPITDNFIQFTENTGNNYITPDETILGIDSDSKGVIWLGTVDGLIRFNPETKQFKAFREEDGLSNNTVYSVLVDHHNRVWASTNFGLSALDQKNLTFRNYSSKSGIQNNEFNSNAHFHNKKTGQFYFGGVNGLTTFHPDAIKLNTNIPKINLTGFKLSNLHVGIENGYQHDKTTELDFQMSQAINFMDKIEVPYIHDDFTFEFSAMNFSITEKNQYSYILEGFDDDWVFAGNKTYAEYANIDPGHYIFKVKGANNDGIWNNETKSIQVTILTPWWETIWFRTGLIVFFIIIVSTGVQLRLRNIARYNNELQLNVELKTDELRSAQKELMAKAHQAGMAEITSSIMHNIGNVLNSVNISSDFVYQELKSLNSDALQKVTKLLGTEIVTLNLSSTSKLAMLPAYLKKLSENIEDKQKILLSETNTIRKHIDHIKHIISIQQTTAKTNSLHTTEQIEELIDEALQISSPKITNNKVKIVKEYNTRTHISVDKHKVLLILINLISNGIDATADNKDKERSLTIQIDINSNNLLVRVIDNGIGLKPDMFDRLFQHGYTTKKNGHGFGLHSSSLAAKQMNGSLSVTSPGEGKGAAFILSLPLPTSQRSNAA